MKYCNINEDNFQYFKPLLPEEMQKRMMADPSVFGMGCHDEDTACGIIVYTMDEETMILRIIYVAVSLSYQRQGIAGGMIRTLARNAYEEGYITLSNFYAKGKYDPRYAIFDVGGDFTIEKLPGGVYVIDRDRLKDVVYDNPSAEYEKTSSGTRTKLSGCLDHTKKLINALVNSSGMEMSLMPSIEEDLSYAVINDEGSPTAVVIISYYEEQHLYEISFISSVLPDQVEVLINILTLALSDVYDRMGQDETLRFSTPVASVDRLAEKYFSKELKKESFYIAGYNGDSVI